MGDYKSPQTKRGYPRREDSNPYKPASKSAEPDRTSSIAQDGGQTNTITTNYPMKQVGNSDRNVGSSSSEVKWSMSRGYVHNESSFGASTRDGNDGSFLNGANESIRTIPEPDLGTNFDPTDMAGPMPGSRGGGDQS